MMAIPNCFTAGEPHSNAPFAFSFLQPCRYLNNACYENNLWVGVAGHRGVLGLRSIFIPQTKILKQYGFRSSTQNIKARWPALKPPRRLRGVLLAQPFGQSLGGLDGRREPASKMLSPSARYKLRGWPEGCGTWMWSTTG